MDEATYPDLRNQTALVTGASRGIGAAVARALARQGCRLGLLARSQDRLERLAEELAEGGAEARPLPADLERPDSVVEAVRAFSRAAGPITLLVNNAGATRDQLLLGMKPEDWEAVIRVNLTGAYHVTRWVLRDMLKARRGSIVNISSIVALSGNPGQSNYVAAKAGLLGLTKSLAREVASRGIRVNAVAPGFIETDMTAALPEEARERYRTEIPLGRFGTPDDVARAVLFLLSAASGYITGAVLNVSGGLYM